MAIAFVCGVLALFALVLFWEAERRPGGAHLQPAGLVRWLTTGNWTAKLGAILLSLGTGALLRYLMLNVALPAAAKLAAGILIAAALGSASAVLAKRPQRRALSLALAGAALAVAYLTAYSAYGFFHFVVDLQALGLLFLVAGVATVVAITRRALSIAVLGMVGAYVAPAFALQAATPLSVYGYYIAASLITLVMVWRRGWRPLAHLSFLFTLAGALFFGWTQQFYTPAYYAQMQPLLLALVALHLAMPLLEAPAGEAPRWQRTDQGYFLLLPLVAVALTLFIAPHLQREGAIGVIDLVVLWVLAAGVQHLRFGQGALRYLSVAALLLLTAALIAIPHLPVLLMVAVVLSLLVAARPGIEISSGLESLAIAVALLTASLYVLQALFEPVSGAILWNAALGRHLLLGLALLAAGWSLRRRRQPAAPVLLSYSLAWLALALARELFRLHFAYWAESAYPAVLVVLAGCCSYYLWKRTQAPNQATVALFGIALFGSALLSIGHFGPAILIVLMLAGQILYSLLAIEADRDEINQSAGSVARSVLPILALPWAVAFNARLGAPHIDVVRTLLVCSALGASVQAQWLVSRTRVWPNWLSPAGFVLFGLLVFYEALFHIERAPWAVAFELIALVYLIETARFLSTSGSRDARLFGYTAIAAVASVGAAMLLRLIGPPGTLTILALNDMLLPATVSLLWAVIGGALTWFSTRNHSRTVWSLGALLLVAAAVKLILFDFGSLGHLGNILAMMAAGAVFLLVAWLAPFPPRQDPPPPRAAAVAAQRHTASWPVEGSPSAGRGWLWVVAVLAGILAYGRWVTADGMRHRQASAAPASAAMINALTPAPPSTFTVRSAEAPGSAQGDACRRFANELPDDYLVYAAGDPSDAPEVTSSSAPTTVDVQLDAGQQKFVLAFGSTGPTLWRIAPNGADRIVGIILSGVHRSEVAGLPADVPVLHAAYEDFQPCGAFQINAAHPQGANRFVSRLRVHAVDADFEPHGGRVVMSAK